MGLAGLPPLGHPRQPSRKEAGSPSCWLLSPLSSSQPDSWCSAAAGCGIASCRNDDLEARPLLAEVEHFGVPADEHVLALDLRSHLRPREVLLAG